MNHKIMTLTIALSTMWMIGCANLAAKTDDAQLTPSIDKVKEFMNDGELYQARKMMRELLTKNPEDVEVQFLMAQVIDREISREHELVGMGPREERPSEENEKEARTWIERSESLLQIGMYDQALLAAEKVFIYDPDSNKASKLIDKIKKEGIKTGKGQMLSQQQTRHEEIADRVTIYRAQANAWINSGQWGAARLAVEKILLLNPEDPEGLKLQEQIQQHQQSQSL